MLILTRTTEQSIRIGDDVTVKVLAIRGNQVRLGITAPDEVDIERTERIATPADTDYDDDRR